MCHPSKQTVKLTLSPYEFSSFPKEGLHAVLEAGLLAVICVWWDYMLFLKMFLQLSTGIWHLIWVIVFKADVAWVILTGAFTRIWDFRQCVVLFQNLSVENKDLNRFRKIDIVSLISTITTDKVSLGKSEILTVHRTSSAEIKKPKWSVDLLQVLTACGNKNKLTHWK